MTRTNAISYEAAIEWALDSYRDFYAAFDKVQDATDPAVREFWDVECSRRAAETCGEQSMICRIYGMSEEKVHDDLQALLARDNELVYI